MQQFEREPPIDWGPAIWGLRQWYATEAGAVLHARVAARVEFLLRNRYARHCLQIGGTQYGVDLLTGRALLHRIHVSGDGADGLRARPCALPLASGSVDLVVLCHALEFHDDPHALLREIDRVLTLDGRIIVIAFNPWSLLGLGRLLGARAAPWCGRFYSPGRLTDWFDLLGWRVQRRETLAFAPPIQWRPARRWLDELERLQRWLPAHGGVQIQMGQKHSIPLTPEPAARIRVKQPALRPVVTPRRSVEAEWR